MRWRQDKNPPYKLIPIDEQARAVSSGAIHGDIKPFVSSVDGSVISDRKQLREHNKRNGVVNASEFPPEHYAQKAKERENHYKGITSRAETLSRKQKIYETMMRAERNG